MAAAAETAPASSTHDAGEKGLKTGALGFVSSVVIGVASTAPGYSLAATLGFITAIAGIGYQAPIVIALAFVPTYLIALAFKYMNQADPDCGTTFTWAGARVRADHRLDRRLGGHLRRRARDGEPRPRSRGATRSSCSAPTRPRPARSGSASPA